MDLLNISIVLSAAFLGGALNAVAGGGSFLTLPALVLIGLPPVSANASGTTALLPGYLSGAYGFRHDIQPLGGLALPWLVLISLLGGLLGAGLLLITPNDTFRQIVPWLLLVATALFAFGQRIAGYLQPRYHLQARHLALGLLLVTIYGGYFNGGLGILLLALFSLIGERNLNRMNALKNLVSALLTLIAVAAYAAANTVHWAVVLPMMLAATVGGYLGAHYARRWPVQRVRQAIIAIGLLMSLAFFFKG